MILVRNVLEIDPAQMQAARELVREMRAIGKQAGFHDKAMTDLVGPFYTLVLESEWKDLAAMEHGLTTLRARPDWQATYARMRPMVRGGRREVYELIA